MPEEDDEDEPTPVVLPLEDTLDLHTFAPRDAADVVREWLDQCAGRFREVRIIHGKGIGNLRRTVHAVLDRHPAVASYALSGDASGWGVTIVQLGAVGP